MNWAEALPGKEDQMKRSLVYGLSALLACSSVAMASLRGDYDQEKADRQRRVQISTGSFLGVELGEINSETVQRLKLREEHGALIEGVTSGSSAAAAGLQKNDVIVKWDGAPIESALELSRHIRETPAGRAIRLGVVRDGHEIEINVKMGERAALLNSFRANRPAPVARVRIRPEVAREHVSDRGHLGVQLQSMTEQLAEYFGLSKRTGALVVFVFADSPAAKAGLKAGDVILNAGGETVENPMDLRRVLTTKPEGSVEFRILRDKQEKTLSVQIEKGTRSWLLEPDDSEDVLAEMAPMSIETPEINVAPVVVSVPKIDIAPMAIEIPEINVAPVVVSVPKIDIAPMAIEIRRLKIAPVAIPSLNIDLTPMKVELPRFKLAPMKIAVPQIKIPAVKIKVVPGRIIL
jgi:serine protease Do